jgi:hypothetical protein
LQDDDRDWPPGRIGVMPYPHPSAFAELKALGVDVVVSLLEAGEAQDVRLRDEGALCVGAGLEFLSLPICDHGVPDPVEPVASLTRELGLRLRRVGTSPSTALPVSGGRRSLSPRC